MEVGPADRATRVVEERGRDAGCPEGMFGWEAAAGDAVEGGCDEAEATQGGLIGATLSRLGNNDETFVEKGPSSRKVDPS